MPKIIVLLSAVLLLAFTESESTFTKYRAVEAYEIRPGILMMPRYSADQQVCELGIERLHYSPEMIRLESTLSHVELERILDELVPSSERGPRTKETSTGGLTVEVGGSSESYEYYENVTITFFADSSSSAKHKKEQDVVAVVKWKGRKCR